MKDLAEIVLSSGQRRWVEALWRPAGDVTLLLMFQKLDLFMLHGNFVDVGVTLICTRARYP